MIAIDHTKADETARTNYNKMAFLCSVMIDVIDSLQDSNQYKQTLKMHCNGALRECEKVVATHYKAFEQHGNVSNDGKDLHSLNVYNITAKSYDAAFDFFTQRPPSEVASFMELVKRAESEGFNLNDLKIEYTPVQV